MPDAPIPSIPAALILGPDDVAVHVTTRLRPSRRNGGCEALYAVVHRRYGTWTHVYAVQVGIGRDRGEVRLLRVIEGYRLDEAARWAAEEAAGGTTPRMAPRPVP